MPPAFRCCLAFIKMCSYYPGTNILIMNVRKQIQDSNYNFNFNTAVYLIFELSRYYLFEWALGLFLSGNIF